MKNQKLLIVIIVGVMGITIRGFDMAWSSDLQCEEHGVSEKECGICQPEMIGNLKPGEGLKIRLKSLKSADKSGIKSSLPFSEDSFGGHPFLCQTTYNQNLLAHLTPLASGVIRNILVDVGDDVSKGDIVVEITSPEIAKAKSEYLSALSNEQFKKLVYQREKQLSERKISSGQEFQQADADYKIAKTGTALAHQQLLNYGFSEEEVKEIEKTQSSSSLLAIRAPFPGTIIERNASIGKAVAMGDNLLTLVDLSSMWLEISIPEDRLSLIKKGNAVEAIFDSLPGQTIAGELTWLSSTIDEHTRLLSARAVLDNANRLLKNNMFGQVQILYETPKKVLSIPANALHQIDNRHFVFVKLSDDLYEIRRVISGAKKNWKVEILDGLSLQEEAVVGHSLTLKSEFLKSRLGAGCADD